MPHDIFVSHVEEDAEVAIELAQELERAGFATWYYERDCLPGPLYLLQVSGAIDQARIVVVIISPHSLSSNQMNSEVVRAYEAGKSFVPLLVGISHTEFQQRQPVWRQALGASTSLFLPTSGVAAVFPRIIAGVRALIAAPVDASSTADPFQQVQRPETTDGRFARFFAVRPDVIAEVEAEASQEPHHIFSEFEKQLLRLELNVHEPMAPSGVTDTQLNLNRMLRQVEKYDMDLEEAKAFVSVSRQPEVPYEEWHDRLRQYQRATGGTTRIRETIIAMKTPVFSLVCLAFRRMNSTVEPGGGWHSTWGVEIELALVMSQLRDFRALPFIADAIVSHQNDMNGHNDFGLGIIRAVRAFGASITTVDSCFESLAGVTCSEILHERLDRDKHSHPLRTNRWTP